jgi:hypothetical protein
MRCAQPIISDRRGQRIYAPRREKIEVQKDSYQSRKRPAVLDCGNWGSQSVSFMVILNEIRVKHKHPNTGWPRN